MRVMVLAWFLTSLVTGIAAAGVSIRPTSARAFEYDSSYHYVVVEYVLTNSGSNLDYNSWQLHLVVGGRQYDDGLHPMVLARYCRANGCNTDEVKSFVSSVAPGVTIKGIAIFETSPLPEQATLMLSAGLGDVTHRITLTRAGTSYSMQVPPKQKKK